MSIIASSPFPFKKIFLIPFKDTVRRPVKHHGFIPSQMPDYF